MKKFIDKHPIIYTSIIVLLALIALNYIAQFFLEKPPGHNLGQEFVLERIYGKESVADYKIVHSEQSLGQRYFPFVEYIEKARSGKLVNVSEQGTRCHHSDQNLCQIKGGRNEIWMFGGSTTFGYGVKDTETIAANLSERLPSFRVINFGTASYYSTIERIRFENLLTEFPPPRAVIFLDGLNDFYYFDVPDKSMVSDAYSLILNKDKGNGTNFRNSIIRFLDKLAIYRLLEEKFGQTNKATSIVASRDQVLKAITRLNLNHSIIESVGDKLGITVLNVIQPIPLYGVGHKTSKVPQELLNFGDHANSGNAYKIMFASELQPYNRPRTLNLAELEIEEGMYVDTVHYSPLFNKEIASKIYEKLSLELR